MRWHYSVMPRGKVPYVSRLRPAMTGRRLLRIPPAPGLTHEVFGNTGHLLAITVNEEVPWQQIQT
ncbi:hypothetical protein W02_19060 [Nitrospira sp. KM1]|nr:hypothetical protein W02_19060 [Nitrospira sp. KM1]